jgi:hypothetical protein
MPLRRLDPPTAGIIHPRQRAVRCISRFQCCSVAGIYNSTHTACCLLLKTHVPLASHQYRPLDVCSASALLVPSTCTRHSHVPEVTPHTHHNRCTGDIITGGTSDTQWIPQRQSKTLSCQFDRYKRTRPMQNITFLPSFLKMTVLSPLLCSIWRGQTAGGPLDNPRDIAVARHLWKRVLASLADSDLAWRALDSISPEIQYLIFRL